MTGRVLAGRYRLEERIATGGMGTVWRARDELLRRPVAVKLLNDALAEDGVVAERFRREALTAASLSHANMADVFDFLEDDGRPGIVMELVEGETLARRIARDGALPIADAVRVASDVLDALQAAHDAGVVHRDVKPGNIILGGDGRVKVTDFGIARAAGDAALTTTGAVVGTPHYAAPEQVRGEPALAASDVYALGAVLYEMLTGRRPFSADSPVAVAMARLTDDPPPPGMLRTQVPAALDEAVMIALARNPAARFPSARAMREALERALPVRAGEPGGTTPPPATAADADRTRSLERTALLSPWERAAEPVRRRLRRGRKGVGRFALLLILAGAGVALAMVSAGPRTVGVPRFAQMSIEEARARASSLGLTIEERSRDDDAPVGTVLTQSPRAGTRVERGTTIVVGVSSGVPPCCEVPDVRGMSRGRAEEALRAAKLAVGDVSIATAEGAGGTVLDQSPARGEVVPEGTEVDLVVARDEPPPSEEGGDEGPGKGKGRGKGD